MYIPRTKLHILTIAISETRQAKWTKFIINLSAMDRDVVRGGQKGAKAAFQLLEHCCVFIAAL